MIQTFFDAIYWAACTLTTVGYGDVYPITTTGRVISMISAVVGIALIVLGSSRCALGCLGGSVGLSVVYVTSEKRNRTQREYKYYCNCRKYFLHFLTAFVFY